MIGKKCWRYTMLEDWSNDSSLSQITDHDQLLDHARGLVDHSLILLGDSSTTTYAMLGDCFDHSPDHSLQSGFLGYM
jgi:hypothetical protein